MSKGRLKIAFVVSHPIQYFVPLYQKLAERDDVSVKVFFTWHAGQRPTNDHGFKVPIAWDIPIGAGYDFELVTNCSTDPGTHHFWGLRNPTLFERVTAWRPDVVHITGWAWLSHLQVLYRLSTIGLPTLFRGDSHLLDEKVYPRWWVKQNILKRVFSWPTGFLVVGSANRAYYEAFGVKSNRFFNCPHSIDVSRFAEPSAALEKEAADWRRRLGIPEQSDVIVYAGKFEQKKRPLDLMRVVSDCADQRTVLVMVGSGELEPEVKTLASRDPQRLFVLPFQNQSQMPLVYRLGDLFVLPSSHNETWGLAINEAMACGRPVLVSDRVGCARDLVDDSCGRIFSWENPESFGHTLAEMIHDRSGLRQMGVAATRRARSFDISCTADALIAAMQKVCAE